MGYLPRSLTRGFDLVPLYEFRCQSCKEQFTELVPASEKDKVVCPKCGSRDLKQVWSPIGFLKGYFGSGGSCGTTGGRRSGFG